MKTIAQIHYDRDNDYRPRREDYLSEVSLEYVILSLPYEQCDEETKQLMKPGETLIRLIVEDLPWFIVGFRDKELASCVKVTF